MPYIVINGQGYNVPDGYDPTTDPHLSGVTTRNADGSYTNVGSGLGVSGASNGNNGAGNGGLIPNYGKNNALMSGLLDGKTPFASGDWDGLIKQLTDRANGTGESLAKQNYNMASQNTTNSIASMARGSGSPGSSQEAMIQMGRVGQGQAAGLATAGTQEQQSAQEGLSKALSSRDMINSGAYQNILGQMLGLNNNEINARLGKQTTDNQSSAMNYQAIASFAAIIAKMMA